MLAVANGDDRDYTSRRRLAPARSSLFENPANRDRTARMSACRVLVELIRAHRAPPLNLTVEQPRLTAFFLENIKQLLLSQRLHGIHGIHLRRVPRGKQTSCPGDQRQHHRSHNRAGSGGFSVLHKEASRISFERQKSLLPRGPDTSRPCEGRASRSADCNSL